MDWIPIFSTFQFVHWNMFQWSWPGPEGVEQLQEDHAGHARRCGQLQLGFPADLRPLLNTVEGKDRKA